MNIKYNLSEKKKEEMKMLYDGTWKSVRYIAETYDVSLMRVRWLVDHKGTIEKYRKWGADWRKRNPQRTKEIGSKAMKKYFATPKGKEVMRINSKKYYKKHHKELRVYYKKKYEENKIKNNK